MIINNPDIKDSFLIFDTLVILSVWGQVNYTK